MKNLRGAVESHFWIEYCTKQDAIDRRHSALPAYQDRVDYYLSPVARASNRVSATPYKTRFDSPGAWQYPQSRPNIIAGYSTRHLKSSDKGLPFGYLLHTTSQRDHYRPRTPYESTIQASTLLSSRPMSAMPALQGRAASSQPGDAPATPSQASTPVGAAAAELDKQVSWE